MEVAKTSEIGEISQKVSQKAEISPKLGEIASEAEKKEKKDRGGYFKQRYQEKKQYWRERYQNIKVSGLVGKNEEQKKYSDAEAYKVLMSLKEYTELNPVKRKNWLDFVKTFRELGDNTGIEVKGQKRAKEEEKLASQLESQAEKGKRIKEQKAEQEREEVLKLELEKKDRLRKEWEEQKEVGRLKLVKEVEEKRTKGEAVIFVDGARNN
ncbi:10322_t:CDS:2 [Funneliformis geosporum]|nr:10322_t:CDS:2 [Funneliformis geosporum]